MGRPLLLALLVVLGLPLGVGAAPTPSPAPAVSPHATQAQLGDVAVLALNGSARGSFATTSMDVAMAQAVQYDAAAARLDRYALDERVANTRSTEARKTLLFESATAVEIRIAALRDAERSLRAAYVARDIDTETFVRRLVSLHARVSGLRATLDRIQAHADDIPQFSMRRRVRLLDGSLFGFEGPVRELALAAMRGDRGPTRLSVAASDQGVVLSTLEDGRYVRESYRSDNRNTETIGGLSLNDVADRASVLYPIAYNPSNSIRTGITGLSGGLYRIDIELREGVIRAYLDGATREVFFEVQAWRLDLLGPRPSASGADNGTRVVVNRSYAGGPIHITVRDAETGTPIETTVVVEGAALRTEADGTLWTLSPDVPYEVTAVGPDGNVTISVRPLVPTTVGGEG